jgi:glycosyltransferase involved in cell wall biosynthesis
MGFPWQSVWLLSAKMLRRPVVLDSPMDFTESPFAHAWHWRKMIAFFSRQADLFLTLASRAYLIEKFRLNPKRVLFIENCPDLERIESGLQTEPAFRFPEGTIRICSSGVTPWHAFDRFIPVFKHLRMRNPSIVWLVISDPACEMIQRLRRSAQELDLLDSIHFLPIIKPFERFVATVAQCDLWISHLDDGSLHARYELRMELLEMGVLAMPVVAALTPALQMHGFADSENILFIDPTNHAKSAERISYYLDHRDELEGLGLRLRQHVLTRFSLREGIDRLIDSLNSA